MRGLGAVLAMALCCLGCTSYKVIKTESAESALELRYAGSLRAPPGAALEAGACSDTSRIVRTEEPPRVWWSLDGVDLVESVLQAAIPAVADSVAGSDIGSVLAVCLEGWSLYLGKLNWSISVSVVLRLEGRLAEGGTPLAAWQARSRPVHSWEERRSLRGARTLESRIWRLLCIATVDALRSELDALSQPLDAESSPPPGPNR